MQQHEVQPVCAQIGKGCLHLPESGIEAMVSRVQLCCQEQSVAWDAAVLDGLSYQVLSVPLRSLKSQRLPCVLCQGRGLGLGGGRGGGGGAGAGAGGANGQDFGVGMQVCWA